MGSDIYERLHSELRYAERKWNEAASSRFGSGGVLTTTGGGNGLTSGIVSVSGGGRPPGPLSAMTSSENVQRLHNVLNAINESFPAAFDEITRKLRGVSIEAIKPILRDMLTDVALYLGGSTAIGMGVGGGIGSLGFGVGAIPGAIVGGWLGFEIGNIIMALTGLKSVVVFMKDAVPAAVRCYGTGFKNAWGEDPTDTAPWKHSAWRDFSMGHVLFLMALLMGIVAYLTRGKGDFGALLSEVRASPKLGPKMAEWLEANKNDLLKNPELQPKASAGGGGAEPPSEQPSASRPLSHPSGPNGTWKKVNEAMSDRARAYQTQITGHTDEAYVVNGVKFDGVTDSGTLLDAKGPGYGKFIDDDGEFRDWYTGDDKLRQQAIDQLRAAQGTPIEWHFADENAADAVREMLQVNGLDIQVIHTPVIN